VSKKSIWWRSLTRFVLFWIFFTACFAVLQHYWSWVRPNLVFQVTLGAIAGDLERVSTQTYAFALASIITSSALSLIVAFGLTYAAIGSLSLRSARRVISERKGDFAAHYEDIHEALRNHPIIGHAWAEFGETLIPPPNNVGPYQNTVRPQSFFNMALGREQMPGLKMMSSLPGYFVGIGLLLTFVGLVLALYKAAAAVNATDANAMQAATRDLLQVATFKFATSIAGLGSSILLSFAFRCYFIVLENSFNNFCHMLEAKLSYLAVQTVTVQMNETLACQLTELKQINSADFFSKMGEAVAPQIQSALSNAIAPVTISIDHAVNRLADSSQSGVSDLISRFTEGVQGGAGAELKELAATLKAMQGSLMEAQRGIHGTGEDFGRRMSEAAENLNRLISEAGANLGASSEKSRAALEDVVGALKHAFEQANQKVEENLGQAANGASAKIEEAMGRILVRLEGQIEGLNAGLSSFQGKMTDQIDLTSTKVAQAQTNAAQTLNAVSAEMANAIQAGVGQALEKIRAEFDRFARSLNSSELSLAAQAAAIEGATSQTRAVADAFHQTAQNVQVASTPLLQSSERVASATEKMTTLIGQSVMALAASQASAKDLAESLLRNIDRLGEMWAGYVGQFERVDQDLARAVSTLSEATISQAQLLTDYASKVDESFSSAIEKLAPALQQLNSNSEEFSEAVLDLRQTLTKSVA